MVKLSTQQVADTVMIQQLITAWATELDQKEGLSIRPLIAQDCAYTVRGEPRHGPDEVVKFYETRFAELEKTPNGTPTMRHVVTNFLIDFTGEDEASATFLLTFFLSPKKPPITDMDGPVALAEVDMKFRREADGHWRISYFDSVQTFQKG